jgi:hypothetical protein
MDFLSNLEKILGVLSPEIGESYFQKAEGGNTPILPSVAPPLISADINFSHEVT